MEREKLCECEMFVNENDYVEFAVTCSIHREMARVGTIYFKEEVA